jgi:ATP-dependent Clp protease ATP-binding subunit ClpA
MFERFTDRARRAAVLAQEEARLLGHDQIGAEHLLLGLVHEGEGVAAEALELLGLSLEAVRVQVEEIIGQGGVAPTGRLPFTPPAKQVLELSLGEAKALGHNHIGTEHLLLGLLRQGKGAAVQVLDRLDADSAQVRRLVLELLAGGGQGAAGQTRLVRMAVPADLRELEEQLARVRRQKEAAIDDQDFTAAATLRDAEKDLLIRTLKREREWAAGVGLGAVIAENHRLHGEVERLQDRLREHGIEPNGGSTQTA